MCGWTNIYVFQIMGVSEASGRIGLACSLGLAVVAAHLSEEVLARLLLCHVDVLFKLVGVACVERWDEVGESFVKVLIAEVIFLAVEGAV